MNQLPARRNSTILKSNHGLHVGLYSQSSFRQIGSSPAEYPRATSARDA